MVQAVQDQMKDAGWIPDDSFQFLIPVFVPPIQEFRDPENLPAGVIIKFEGSY